MDILALNKLVGELLIAISALTGQELDGRIPNIQQVPAMELAQKVCGRPCPVYALFEPQQGILLDKRLDIEGDANARSILVHELFHYVQWRTSKGGAKGCEEWLQREREAYIIQHRWLNGRPPNEPRQMRLSRPMAPGVVCKPKRTYAFGG